MSAVRVAAYVHARSHWRADPWGSAVNGPGDRWIRWTTTACVALLALIAGTVSYLHMHLLVELNGQPGWVAALTPLSVDGMIVAASTTLLADSRSGGRGGILPRTLLASGSVASLAANVAVAEQTATGRVIAAWPSFALIAAYELLMRQIRRSAVASGKPQRSKPGPQISRPEEREETGQHPSRPRRHSEGPAVRALRAGIFSCRRGSGHWPTGPRTARCRAGARLPSSMVGTSDGAASSSARVPLAKSPPATKAANHACAWSSSDRHRPQANDSGALRAPNSESDRHRHGPHHQLAGHGADPSSRERGRPVSACRASSCASGKIARQVTRGLPHLEPAEADDVQFGTEVSAWFYSKQRATFATMSLSATRGIPDRQNAYALVSSAS
jgi:hypothetical protein